MNLSNEFINTLIKICIGFEVFTAIVGTIFFYKYKNVKFLRYFIFFIWYVAFNELVGLYIKLDGGVNAIIHNIYNAVNFTFFLLLYRYYFKNNKNKKLALYFSIIYLSSFIINGFFENYIEEYQRLPYILGALFLVISILLYFFEILNSEQVLNAKKNLLIWISFGLLIYFVGNLPFRILRNYYIELTDATVLLLVNITLTVIMNTCFIIGFIWSDKKQQY
ncbi:hypothetical protein D1818_11815 [Aquimarina sp. BL5]|uniref:hypothetical protein n=1 Tax=Aquimarina sp. BL5 TaxID=1714860 RepID=UPI000E48A9E0|nr:hypothetical protein [Aquimarina sp. BL5]AXT51487.1 hypothetical protein D1818_11815 [Aquimarina sp. BL5]RKN03014.1 hypothetical protein D7036_14975 [Aquimarina sp. BL5]